MQLNSRRLTDGEYFDAFLKLDEIRRSNPNSHGSSDEAIGQQLNKSARQVYKMREIAKKATPEILEKIKNGSISINKAHEMIKTSEAKRKTGEAEVPAESISNTGKVSIRILSNLEFCLSCLNWKKAGRKARF